MAVVLSLDEATLHPARAAILEAVSASPGISFLALARQVDRPAGTVRHHLNVLVRSALLREERVGGAVAFLRSDDRRSAVAVRVLRDPAMVALRDLVASGGRVCQRDLLDYLDGIWSRSTVQHRLGRLVAAGVLRVQYRGRFLVYEVAA